LDISGEKGFILDSSNQSTIYEAVKKAINLNESELAWLKSENLKAGEKISYLAYIKEVEIFLERVEHGN
jgi:hypothetical protein